ncbi:MAG TPA: hypothetical protein VJG90_06735 [Candidatus Nanoarchaeia archaeon]|nr:hypothetical protein [Candidatus Nanoarchaeia archaeon]
MPASFEKLQSVLGSDLIGISEYEGKYVVILKRLGFDVLDKAYEEAQKINPLPLFLTEEEIIDGLDVFPLEYLTMQQTHSLLYGKDVFSELEFSKEDIRRQLEFEFRSKLIQLREGYLAIAHSQKLLQELLQKATPTLLPLCRGLLFLKTKDLPERVPDIYDELSNSYRINVTILHKLYNMRSYSEDEQKEIIQKLIALLQEMSQKLDKLVIR